MNAPVSNFPCGGKNLPCRGCTEDCRLRHRCAGRLWRLNPQASASLRSVVVFGGSGFIGAAIAKRLVERGFRVTCISRQGMAPRHLRQAGASWINSVDWLKGDVSTPDPAILNTAYCVITTVGSPPLPTFSKQAFEAQYQANGGGNIQLLEACVDAGVKQLIAVGAHIPKVLQRSGFGYYKGKQDFIDRAKALAAQSQTGVTVIQPSAVYGTRHTASGRVIPLNFLRPLSQACRAVAKCLPEGISRSLVANSPVSVDAIARRVAEECESCGGHEPVLKAVSSVDLHSHSLSDV